MAQVTKVPVTVQRLTSSRVGNIPKTWPDRTMAGNHPLEPHAPLALLVIWPIRTMMGRSGVTFAASSRIRSLLAVGQF